MRKNSTKAFQLLFVIVAFLPVALFAQTDIGAIGLVAPAQQGCYGNAQTVTIRIKNFSAGTHNFATAPVTLNASVSGPNAMSFPAVIVSTGSLPAGDSMNVVIVTNYNMIATGAYVFNANTNFGGDVNTGNNAMSPTTVNVQALSAGSITASPAAYCGAGGTPALTLSGGNGGTIQWQESSTGIAGTWTNVGANLTTYTPTVAITATRYYRAYRTCNSNTDTGATLIVPLANPQLLTTTPGSVCGPGSVTLGATTTSGNTIYWSPTPNLGGTIGIGTTYVTPSLSATTNFYASSWTSIGTVDVGIKPSDFAVCGGPVTSAATDYPLRFTTTKPLTINSAIVIPSSTSLSIALRHQGTTIDITTMSFSFTPAQVGLPQQIALGLYIPVPGNYQLTNTVGGLWRINTPACSYPFISPFGSMSITGSATSSNTTTTNTSFYNGFFQININEGCLSAPVPVLAQVNMPATITQQPVNVSTCQGSTIHLVVGAQGTGLNYQWRKNGVTIANSNNDTLTFSPVTSADGGSYDVIITGGCGAPVTSNTITMNVAATCIWSGGVSTEWNNVNNWNGGVPGATSNIIIQSNTPFQPTISSGTWDVKSITISSNSTLLMLPTSALNIYGDFTNYGTFSANANVNFRGSVAQNVYRMSAGNVQVNGSGIVLTEAMTVNQALILTNGNITLGTHALTINESTAGSLASHVITNGTGAVVAKKIDIGSFTIPVGPSATSYNPVIIKNGESRDFEVKVATGLNPAIGNPAIAVNRTWTIIPNSAPASFVNIILQYEDSHMNAMGQPAGMMHVGFHDGSGWWTTGGVIPTGTSTARQVSFSTKIFGPMAVANLGGIVNTTSLPATIEPSITSIQLLPGIVNSSAILKVVSTKASKIKWDVIDAQGRTVMSLDGSLHQGQNDIQLQLQHLAPGVYSLNGVTGKGRTGLVRFVKQ